MSICAHAVIGQRRHVAVGYLKEGRFPWQHFTLYHFSVLKKGGEIVLLVLLR
jgi:hypothetical protein